jgi:hypothetical protein
LVLILSNNKNGSRNRGGYKRIITGVINPAKNESRVVVQVGDHPLSYFGEILFLEIFDEFIYRDV